MMEEPLISQVPVGAVFQHYRNKKNYKILGVGRHTETMELQVVYQGLYHCDTYGESPVWVRPLHMFLETIDNEGSSTSRFIRID